MVHQNISTGIRIFILLLISFSRLSAADFIFNEIVPTNGNTVADEDGDYGDWIELHNPGTEPADLAGWGLSDSPSSPFKWIFPQATVINGGGYLLVWASGKDRIDPLAPLHTNFSISRSGERIILTRPGGVLADESDVPALTRDTSYGRIPGDLVGWFYFATPTPEAENNTPGYSDPTVPPTFSHQGGFHTTAFSLDITAPPGWTVYYSLDGSEPDPTRVGALALPYRESFSYSQVIPVASRIGDPNVFSMIDTTDLTYPWLPEWEAPTGEAFKGTIVRAVAHDPATGRTSAIATRTFLVDPNIMTRYPGMPVISLVSDYKHLFDDATGIYVPGTTHGGDIDAQNFFQGWKKPANIEYFDIDGTPGFSDIYEISMQGSTSPAGMQKGLHVVVGDESVNSSIDYPLFATTESSASQLDEFRRFMLRAWGSARNWEVFFTDAYHQTLLAKSDMEIQAYRPTIVFINGEYWGLHEMREANKNSWYHQSRTGIDRDDPGFDLLNEGGTEVDEGDSIHWDAVMAYIDVNDLSDDTVYQYVVSQIDVENFAQYVIHSVFVGKRDWPEQNEAQWRARTPDGRWRWTQFDMDHGLNDWAKPEYDMLQQVFQGSPENYGPHPLLVELMVNPDFEEMFIKTYADWLNTYFLSSVTLSHFDAMEAELAPFIAEFDDRWPNAYDFDTGTAYGRDIVDRRRSVRRTQFRNRFGLGSPLHLTLLADPSMGLIRCNTTIIDENTPGVSPGAPYPWTGTYYQYMLVELEALPKADQRFVGWQVKIGGVNLLPLPGGDPTYYSQQTVIEVALADEGEVEAVFEPIPIIELPGPVHVWDFENGNIPQPSLTAGDGYLTIDPATGTLIEPVEKGFTSSHLRVNDPVGVQMDWAMPTTGFDSISLDYSTRRSGSGAGLQSLSYTIDGLSWTLVEAYSVADSSPQPKSFDFSGTTGVADNPDFAVRVTFAMGAGGLAGNNRFDDVILTGTALSGTNLPPRILTPIENRQVVAGGAPSVLELGSYFEDPDGDPLVFQVQSVSPSPNATASVNGLQLSVSGLISGETQVTVAALVDGVASTSQTFAVLVYPSPFPVTGGVFRFTEWFSSEPAGSYPNHMLFLQSEVSDPVLATPLDHAYNIPATDADFPQDALFPYAATSRSRINGLGEQGISFINTGRDRDVGAALLALNTIGQSDMELRWTAGTDAVNGRIYAMSLQYRLDIGDAWTVFPGGVMPVQYISSTQVGDEVAFGPVSLPLELENQPHVQILWRYHYLSGTGSRSEIRLDDVVLYSARTYQEWVADSFAPGDAGDPAMSGPLVEYINDGHANLLKYALGVSPSAPVTTDQLEMGIKPDGRLFARFHLDRTLSDITYRLEVSPDLLDWSELAFDSQDFWEANSDGSMHEVIVPAGVELRKFIRLSIQSK